MNKLKLPEVGKKFGKFEVLDRLGAGGMGVVYLVNNPFLDRRQALKVLKPEIAEDEKGRALFEREIKSLANFSEYYEWIVQAYDADIIGGLPYLLMEYLPSGSVFDWVKAAGTLPLDVSLKLALETANALNATSSLGIAHRDVKPSNILLRTNGYIGLSDFGLAAPFSKEQEGRSSGTLQYMSPEQLDGGAIDARSDIFSLGGTLHFMLTGKAPFGYTLKEILGAHFDGRPAVLRELDESIPQPLVALLSKALAKKREYRFQSPKGMAAAISKVADSLPGVDLEHGLTEVRNYAVLAESAVVKRFSEATLETELFDWRQVNS